MEESLEKHWSKWDKDGSGFIEVNEMLEPRHGLVAYVRAHLPNRVSRGEPPNIQRDPKAWFKFWDEDGNGTLEFEEVVRALIKSFKMGTNHERIYSTRVLLQALWIDFDPDNNGHIDVSEFSKREGLAETIVANLGI